MSRGGGRLRRISQSAGISPIAFRAVWSRSAITLQLEILSLPFARVSVTTSSTRGVSHGEQVSKRRASRRNALSIAAHSAGFGCRADPGRAGPDGYRTAECSFHLELE